MTFDTIATQRRDPFPCHVSCLSSLVGGSEQGLSARSPHHIALQLCTQVLLRKCADITLGRHYRKLRGAFKRKESLT